MDWRNFLLEQIPHQLPGEASHLEMMPMRGLSSKALKVAKNPKESAVAIHLIQEDDDLQILLTQRNTYDGAHSGQISFPGGKRDLTDLDAIHTARRESFEEIAMPYENGELIGALTEIYIPVSNFHVKPFVFYHEELSFVLQPDPREVSTIFRLPVNILIQDELLTYIDIPLSPSQILPSVPCFKYQDYIIWGATAILLNELKVVLRRKDNLQP